jgi:hypothetical protein
LTPARTSIGKTDKVEVGGSFGGTAGRGQEQEEWPEIERIQSKLRQVHHRKLRGITAEGAMEAVQVSPFRQEGPGVERSARETISAK